MTNISRHLLLIFADEFDENVNELNFTYLCFDLYCNVNTRLGRMDVVLQPQLVVVTILNDCCWTVQGLGSLCTMP